MRSGRKWREWKGHGGVRDGGMVGEIGRVGGLGRWRRGVEIGRESWVEV